jgi:hypothetical protein
MQNDKRRGAAYHEAGHATVAWEADCKVIAIVIEENGDGRTDTECNYGRMSFIDRLALCYAGEAAQTMFDAETHETAAAEDWGKLVAYCGGLLTIPAKSYKTQGSCEREKFLSATVKMSSAWRPI